MWNQRRNQERLNTLETNVAEMPGRWQQDISDARREISEEQQRLERRLADARIHLRLLGVAFVVGRLALSLIGNLI